MKQRRTHKPDTGFNLHDMIFKGTKSILVVRMTHLQDEKAKRFKQEMAALGVNVVFLEYSPNSPHMPEMTMYHIPKEG